MFLRSLSLQSHLTLIFFFLMIRRPPRSTQSRSSAASDVYKRQASDTPGPAENAFQAADGPAPGLAAYRGAHDRPCAVSYTHLRAHETPEHLVCRLLLEKKNNKLRKNHTSHD